MSDQDPNYKKALERSDISWSPAIGLLKEGSSVTQSVLAKQNNQIIELLISLHNRIERIENQLALQNNSRLIEQVGEITASLKNIKLGERKPEVVTPGTGVIAVWKDPRKQIEDFRKKHGQA